MRLAPCAAAVAAGIALAGCGGSAPTTGTTAVTASASGAAPGSSSAHPGAGGTHGSTHTGAAPSGHGHAGAAGKPGTATGTSRESESASTGSGGAAAGASSLTRHVVDTTENVRIIGHQGQVIIQRGVVKGIPIGTAMVVMHDVLTNGGVNASFVVTGSGGSVWGLGQATLQVKGSSVSYNGSAHFTRGTGIYSRIRAPHLTVTGTGNVSGDTTLHVTGVEWY